MLYSWTKGIKQRNLEENKLKDITPVHEKTYEFLVFGSTDVYPVFACLVHR